MLVTYREMDSTTIFFTAYEYCKLIALIQLKILKDFSLFIF